MMNDLEMVRALRADAPRPSGDRLAEGRSRLRAATVPGQRRRHPAMIITAAATAAAAAAAIVLWPAGRSAINNVHPVGSRPPSVQLLSVTVVLRNAAAAAQRRPAVLPGPHQWLFEKGVKAAPAGRGRFITQSWTRFDGEQSADIEHGRLVILPYGPAQDGVPEATPQGAAAYLRSLPPSPKALLGVIYRKAEAEPPDQWAAPGNRDSEAFSILMTLMINATAGVPSAVQANVFRAAALIPGVRVSKSLDALGRPALALSAAGLNGSFLLDPGTYALIGLRDGGAAITKTFVAVVNRPGQR